MKKLNYFIPEFNKGFVVDVHDGDTIKVDATIGVNEKCDYCKKYVDYKWCLRLKGIDAPELKGASSEDGKFVRDKLKEKILGKFVDIQLYGYDKYGRLLAEIFYDKVNINQWLIDMHYALAYEGGHKRDWTCQHFLKEGCGSKC